jgi:hypothetical protein
MDLLPLLTLLLARAGAFPAFAREVAVPAVPKCSQALVACAVEAEGRGEWGVVVSLQVRVEERNDETSARAALSGAERSEDMERSDSPSAARRKCLVEHSENTAPSAS